MTDVILHIYDVTNSGSDKTNNTIVNINKIFKDGIGLGGIFHSAVQVSPFLLCFSFSFFYVFTCLCRVSIDYFDCFVILFSLDFISGMFFSLRWTIGIFLGLHWREHMLNDPVVLFCVALIQVDIVVFSSLRLLKDFVLSIFSVWNGSCTGDIGLSPDLKTRSIWFFLDCDIGSLILSLLKECGIFCITLSLFRSCFNPILAMDNHRFYSEILHGNDSFQDICYFVCLTSNELQGWWSFQFHCVAHCESYFPTHNSPT